MVQQGLGGGGALVHHHTAQGMEPMQGMETGASQDTAGGGHSPRYGGRGHLGYSRGRASGTSLFSPGYGNKGHPEHQRGLIYTKHKPKCRLCVTRSFMSYEIPSAKVFQLVCYTATFVHHKGCRQESWPDWRLAHLSRRRGARGQAFLVMEDCKDGLLT